VPPKAATDYTVTVPEALGDRIKADDLKASPDFQAMLGKMHAAGLSQKQVDTVVGEFLDRSIKLQERVNQLDSRDCIADLRKDWTNEQEYSANVAAAVRAARAYGDFDQIEKRYGNDPVMMRFLAKVGAELAEDTSAPAGAQVSAADLESLVKSKAYADPRHPDHTATKQRVDAMYQRMYPGQKRAGPIVISTT
jgi:hypothetical protein